MLDCGKNIKAEEPIDYNIIVGGDNEDGDYLPFQLYGKWDMLINMDMVDKFRNDSMIMGFIEAGSDSIFKLDDLMAITINHIMDVPDAERNYQVLLACSITLAVLGFGGIDMFDGWDGEPLYTNHNRVVH